MQPQPPAKPKQGASEDKIAQDVSAKLEDGNLRVAIRLLVSEVLVSQLPTTSGLAKLQEKYPPCTLDASALPLSPLDAHLLVIDSDIHKAGWLSRGSGRLKAKTFKGHVKLSRSRF